jgi:hypothetical protein
MRAAAAADSINWPQRGAQDAKKKGSVFASSAPLCGYSSGAPPLQYMQHHLLLSRVTRIDGLM